MDTERDSLYLLTPRSVTPKLLAIPQIGLVVPVWECRYLIRNKKYTLYVELHERPGKIPVGTGSAPIVDENVVLDMVSMMSDIPYVYNGREFAARDDWYLRVESAREQSFTENPIFSWFRKWQSQGTYASRGPTEVRINENASESVKKSSKFVRRFFGGHPDQDEPEEPAEPTAPTVTDQQVWNRKTFNSSY